MNRCLCIAIAFCISLVSGCANRHLYIQMPVLADLKVTLADASWDGRSIPAGQQCLRDGGHGATPAINVANIPPQSTQLLIEFSDKSFIPMDNGGHGIIGYHLKPGTTEVTLPSIPGHTFDLPEPFFVVSAHRRAAWDIPGAYLPPCSGGKGNYYYVTIKALYAPDRLEQMPEMLGRGKINLGRY
ncbi:MAG: hypothetical protein ABIL58_06375 [Pseudomonadota bacterium]